ncbi:hypothetical protein [Nocardioides aequoreus]|uniref:hypothetical protein n=1 Tax=Nocardioides aequoreus TaxID=397278 RepID=UPI00068B3D4F|nr:hypothetical protein [Nocardioides aequoreus]
MRALRLLLGAAGVAATAYGALLLWRLDLADLLDALLWLAAGVLVHDALVAPLTVLGVLALRRVVPVTWWTAVTVGTVVLLTVTVTAAPVLGRFGARPDNPTLLDRDYLGGWLLLAALVLAGVLVGVVVGRRRRRVARHPDQRVRLRR